MPPQDLPQPMESHRRSIAKAVSWQLLGLLVSTAIGVGFTGDVAGGLRLAGTLAAAGLVLYTAHERLWARVRWGIERQSDPILFRSSRHRSSEPHS